MAMRKFDWDYPQLRAMYEGGMSTKAIGAQLCRDWRLVRYHLKRAGVSIRSTGESRALSAGTGFEAQRDQIIAEHQAGTTLRALQRKYAGYGKDRIAALCRELPQRELAVPRQPAKLTPELRAKYAAAAKANWDAMTPEQREQLRAASIASKLGERNHNFGRIWATQGRGKRTPGVGCHGQPITFRSTWEKKFADYLNAQKVEWKYEPEAIRCGELGTYTPDFYVEPWGCFVEVKGWLAPTSLKKIEWVRQNDERPIVLATKNVLRQHYGVEVN